LGLDRNAVAADLDQQVVEVVAVHRAALTGRELQHPDAHLVVLEHDLGTDWSQFARHPLNPIDAASISGPPSALRMLATVGPPICACLELAARADNRAEARVTGGVIVGTGFGCITHLRALRAAGFAAR